MAVSRQLPRGCVPFHMRACVGHQHVFECVFLLYSACLRKSNS